MVVGKELSKHQSPLIRAFLSGNRCRYGLVLMSIKNKGVSYNGRSHITGKYGSSRNDVLTIGIIHFCKSEVSAKIRKPAYNTSIIREVNLH